MNEDIDRLNALRKPAAVQRLADHLAALGSQAGSILPSESDMLSLIVSGALSGEDISRRYPAFYRRLLEDPGLRQAFLDALESVEAERAGQMQSMPEPAGTGLDFLGIVASAPIVEVFEAQKWRATWRRSLEQLQALFSPPELAYRAGSLSEDPWFTLLRDELKAAGTIFAVALDCTLSSESEEALSAFLSLAVTLTSSSEPAPFPLRASLQWGDYQASVLLSEEGRARFPDIPLESIFDQVQGQITAGFGLSLETAS